MSTDYLLFLSFGQVLITYHSLASSRKELEKCLLVEVELAIKDPPAI